MSETKDNPWIQDATPANFDDFVTGRSSELPVVVDFWAPWCGPCRALGPILEKLTQEYGGKFLLLKANSDELQDAAAKFNVQGIPAVYAVLDGEVIDFFSGAIPETMIRQWIDRVLANSVIHQAKRLLDKSPADAEKKYREILASDPKNVDAQIGLAKSLFLQQRLVDSQAIVDELEKRGYLEPEVQKLKASLELRNIKGGDVDQVRKAAKADPNNLELQYQLAEALVGEALVDAQAFEEALEILLTLVERDRKGVGEKARQRMVDIFQALPEDSELTTRFRRKLSMALY